MRAFPLFKLTEMRHKVIEVALTADLADDAALSQLMSACEYIYGVKLASLAEVVDWYMDSLGLVLGGCFSDCRVDLPEQRYAMVVIAENRVSLRGKCIEHLLNAPERVMALFRDYAMKDKSETLGSHDRVVTVSLEWVGAYTEHWYSDKPITDDFIRTKVFEDMCEKFPKLEDVLCGDFWARPGNTFVASKVGTKAVRVFK